MSTPANINAFFTALPPTKHTITSLDVQPISQLSTTPQSGIPWTSLLISVGGTVIYGIDTGTYSLHSIIFHILSWLLVLYGWPTLIYYYPVYLWTDCSFSVLLQTYTNFDHVLCIFSFGPNNSYNLQEHLIDFSIRSLSSKLLLPMLQLAFQWEVNREATTISSPLHAELLLNGIYLRYYSYSFGLSSLLCTAKSASRLGLSDVYCGHNAVLLHLSISMKPDHGSLNPLIAIYVGKSCITFCWFPASETLQNCQTFRDSHKFHPHVPYISNNCA